MIRLGMARQIDLLRFLKLYFTLLMFGKVPNLTFKIKTRFISLFNYCLVKNVHIKLKIVFKSCSTLIMVHGFNAFYFCCYLQLNLKFKINYSYLPFFNCLHQITPFHSHSQIICNLSFRKTFYCQTICIICFHIESCFFNIRIKTCFKYTMCKAYFSHFLNIKWPFVYDKTEIMFSVGMFCAYI